jgi:protein-S-isoprenylcysteine O-methyltransferase Ste14
MRAVEVLRPDVVAGDERSAEDDPFRRELPRAYAVSAAAVLASPLLGASAVRLPPVSGPLGLGVQGAGIGLRVWAMRELHGHYARTLRVVDEQPVVRSGPYRYVRHPGYLGSLLICVGAALSARNVTAVALTTTAVGTAYEHRMDAEDALLRRDLPGYADYAATTHRLVPSGT